MYWRVHLALSSWVCLIVPEGLSVSPVCMSIHLSDSLVSLPKYVQVFGRVWLCFPHVVWVYLMV